MNFYLLPVAGLSPIGDTQRTWGPDDNGHIDERQVVLAYESGLVQPGAD